MKKISLFFVCIFLINAIFADKADTEKNLESLYNRYSPNFEIALGSKDAYFGKFYAECMKNQNSGKSRWGVLRINPKKLGDFVGFCRNLYETNKLSKIEIEKKPRIPLIIHQIWLGSPLPEKYKKWQQTWQNMPGWQYKLWTDEDVNNMQEFVNKDIYLASKNYGQRADILRIEILKQFGGLYVDMDFECLNPEMFTTLNHAYDLYAALHPLDCIVFGLENGLIGCTKDHPVMKNCILELRKVWTVKTTNRFNEIIVKSGPGLFTKVFWEFGGKNQRDIIFPPTFFYPLGYYHAKFCKFPEPDKLKQIVCRPETMAIHWWAGSWQIPSSNVKKSSRHVINIEESHMCFNKYKRIVTEENSKNKQIKL